MLVKTVETLATLAAMYMNISPLNSIQQMHQRQQIPANVSLVPLLAMLANSGVWMIYGVVIQSFFPMVVTNLFGFFASCYYIHSFYLYVPAKTPVFRKTLIVAGFLVSCGMYPLYSWQPRDVVVSSIGYICVFICILMYASPLSSIQTVFQTKSSACLPFALVVAGCACSFLWLSYGVLVNDAIVMFPNAVSLALGLFQLSLFVFFPAAKAIPSTK